MSRIYTNSKLGTLPVHTHNLQSWPVAEFTKSGNGVLLEGTVQHKSRHMVLDAGGQKYRYYVVHTAIKQAHRRQFDSSGNEMNPNFSEKNKVSTGYLMSSYKVQDKGKTDKILNNQLPSLLNKPQLLDCIEKHSKPGTIGFWMDEKDFEKLDINIGDPVRIKTKGNSPFIDQLIRVEEASKTVSNMAGDEPVGASWTDKILANKTTEEKLVETGEGVDDDEWDD